MMDLCCLINPGWLCTLCKWQVCDACLQARVDKAPPEYYSVVDDVHREDEYCIGRAGRV